MKIQNVSIALLLAALSLPVSSAPVSVARVSAVTVKAAADSPAPAPSPFASMTLQEKADYLRGQADAFAAAAAFVKRNPGYTQAELAETLHIMSLQQGIYTRILHEAAPYFLGASDGYQTASTVFAQ